MEPIVTRRSTPVSTPPRTATPGLCRAQRAERSNAVVFQADAMRLPFGDDTFDHVFISHVISVVSDPYKLVAEAQRVAKPGARIVVVNHFQSRRTVELHVVDWHTADCAGGAIPAPAIAAAGGAA